MKFELLVAAAALWSAEPKHYIHHNEKLACELCAQFDCSAPTVAVPPRVKVNFVDFYTHHFPAHVIEPFESKTYEAGIVNCNDYYSLVDTYNKKVTDVYDIYFNTLNKELDKLEVLVLKNNGTYYLEAERD